MGISLISKDRWKCWRSKAVTTSEKAGKNLRFHLDREIETVGFCPPRLRQSEANGEYAAAEYRRENAEAGSPDRAGQRAGRPGFRFDEKTNLRSGPSRSKEVQNFDLFLSLKESLS